MGPLHEKELVDVEKIAESSIAEGNSNAHEDSFHDTHTSENKALVKKFDQRILPLSAFIYLLCYLDRSNIGKHSTLRISD
jgi:hypothetical protein